MDDPGLTPATTRGGYQKTEAISASRSDGRRPGRTFGPDPEIHDEQHFKHGWYKFH